MKPRMTAIGLLISWATPAASLPSEASFSVRYRTSSSRWCSVDVVRDHEDTVRRALLGQGHEVSGELVVAATRLEWSGGLEAPPAIEGLAHVGRAEPARRRA